MSILIWLTASAIVYVSTFNGDFTKEHTEKAVLFISVLAVVVLMITVLIALLD